MALTIFFTVLCIASLVMLVRQIIDESDKKSIASAVLSSEQLEFVLPEAGKHTIWTKRITKFSLLKRGVHNYTYQLTNKKSGEIIPLSKQKDDSEISNNRRGSHPVIENIWKTHYSFDAPAGTYVLTFKKSDVLSQAKGSFGLFNLFKEINAEKYTVEITPYYDKLNALKKGLLIALYFLLTFGSLFLLFMKK